MRGPAEPLKAIEVFHDGREAINIVLGALLGAYLGLIISAHGIGGASYWYLAYFLVGTISFITALNAAADRFHRELFGLAAWYALGCPLGLMIALPAAMALPVDVNILLVTFGVWVFALSFEASTAAVAFVFARIIRK
ncbi:MAG: hypothetical protein ACOY45_03360 [Pseudomonadota bacterium]